jgi:hypothetical protein
MGLRFPLPGSIKSTRKQKCPVKTGHFLSSD